MKALLDPRKYLGIALENIHDFWIRLLKKTDGSRDNFSQVRKSSSVVRRPKKDNTAGTIEDTLKMFLRSLPRLKQGLSSLVSFLPASSTNVMRYRTSLQTSPPRLWQTKMTGRSFYLYQQPETLIDSRVSYLTVSSLSRYDERDVSRFQA